MNMRSMKLGLSLAASMATLTAAPSAHAKTGDKIPGEYIVTFRDYAGAQSDDLGERVARDANIDLRTMKGMLTGAVNGFHGKLTPAQLERLRRDPRVQEIEQDQEISVESWPKGDDTIEPLGVYDPIPPQPAQSIPWNVALVGYGDGTGKTVWVIDSGLRPDHPDLNVDLTRSKSFVSGVTSILDGCGHGTSVAGVIGAKNNSIGILGVAHDATLVALRVFNDSCAGTLSAAISAVNHVNNHGKAGDVVNMSLGSGPSSTLDNLVRTAASKGIFFAIAAGNSSEDCSNTSPARVDAPNVYTVSSMNRYGVFSSFSNYGPPVDRAAPGEEVITTTNSGGYGSGARGTSFSAPHVAGLLALVGNNISYSGYVTGDKDSWADPIASK
jgi:hypothetical protein